MLSLNNPLLNLVHNEIISKYINYISQDQTSSCGFKGLVESDPHVTLIYDLDPGVGRNKLYHLIKIQHRDEYNAIRKLQFLTIDNPIINTFDNEDYRVVKVDLMNCNEYQVLRNMSDKLMELPNNFSYGGDKYHPHLTLTYLKPDAPDFIIDELNNKFSKLLNRFLVKEFIISGSEGDNIADYQDRFI